MRVMDIVVCRECGEAKPRMRKHNRICRECLSASKQAWREANPHYSREKMREWRAGNRERDRASRRDYQRRRRADLDARTRDNVACAIHKEITRRGGGGGVVSSWIGYPVARIVEWARKEGYNPPHNEIDHIVPVKWWVDNFPLVEALRGAWRLSNLRIIPAGENRRKGSRREFLV